MMTAGLDANILLRVLLNDDASQAAVSRKFLMQLGENQKAYVGTGAILEVFWVLRSRYRLPRPELVKAIRTVLKTDNLLIESFDAIAEALSHYEEGLGDFPDALLAARNLEAGCGKTLTFDKRAAARVPGMELLA
jgi:predicted nucleic-acid-binding protein